MEYISVGMILKIIRENVFQDSLRGFSDKMCMNHNTYGNYEKNRQKKNSLRIINEFSERISEIVSNSSVAKSKLKEVILDIFIKKSAGDSQDYNYLTSIDITENKEVYNYIKYVLLLAYRHQNAEHLIESEDKFHGQRRFCINKTLEFWATDEIFAMGHIEDYQIFFQMALDNKEKIFKCILKGCSDHNEKLINEKCEILKIKNLELLKGDLKYILKINKIKFVMVCYYFHHIQKMSDKIKFLKNLYDNIQSNGFVCVADPFFDEEKDIEFLSRWKLVKEETYAKKFWTTLDSADDISIKYAEDYAKRAEISEDIMGKNYLNKVNEYIETVDWMTKVVNEIGYEIILNKRSNCYTDRIYLLRK